MKPTAGVKFSDTLRAWRERQRLTQAAAAEFLGKSLRATVNLETFRAWEYGRNEPNEITRSAVERVLSDSERKTAKC